MNQSNAITAKRFKAATSSAALAFVAGITLMGVPALASAENSSPPLDNPGSGDFPDAALDHWLEKAFVGQTRYEIVDAQGAKVLKGTSEGTASVFYREQQIDLLETPWIEWTWRVENTLDPIVEQTKGGDDYAGRLYVVIQTGFLPWETTAVNYVWSSNTEKDTHWVSPYTDKSVMVAVRSGETGLGEWHYERRNVVQDFKEFFGLDVKRIDGYAVMVDTDNSGKSATAYFGNIDFKAE